MIPPGWLSFTQPDGTDRARSRQALCYRVAAIDPISQTWADAFKPGKKTLLATPFSVLSVLFQGATNYLRARAGRTRMPLVV